MKSFSTDRPISVAFSVGIVLIVLAIIINKWTPDIYACPLSSNQYAACLDSYDTKLISVAAMIVTILLFPPNLNK